MGCIIVASVFVLDGFYARARSTLSSQQFSQLDSLFDRLSNNPVQGRILDSRGLREFRLGSKRVYFVTTVGASLFVDVSTKKNQQRIIDSLRKRLPPLLELLNELS